MLSLLIEHSAQGNLQRKREKNFKLHLLQALKMPSVGYLESFLAIFFCFLICILRHMRNNRRSPTNLPVFGMFPELCLQMCRIHDRIIEVMEQYDCTFLFKGPWFTNMNILCTVNPANVQHIMSTNFSNYPKGPKFQQIFEILGGGFFNADSDSWKSQRKVAQAYLSDRRFFSYLMKIAREKVKKGLVPVLENVSQNGVVVDLQSLFKRLGNDVTWIFVTGYDPESLTIKLPEEKLLKALDDAEEAIFYRHIVPESLWKFQRWLGVGQEKKYKKSWEAIDKFIADYLATKRENLAKSKEDKEEVADLLSTYMKEENDDKFLRDIILNFLVAGRESTSSTLTWLVWLVAIKPDVKAKIREELKALAEHEAENMKYFFNVEELNKLVYLHAVICETLRLYPAVPFQVKSPVRPDFLPSGHRVDPSTKILFPRCAMGRTTKLWGKDCFEFKPERWITEHGEFKHESSYKFFAFNAGPRICPGKEMSLIQLKAIAAVIIYNYDIHVVEDHPVAPGNSVILHMKHGFMARVARRR